MPIKILQESDVRIARLCHVLTTLEMQLHKTAVRPLSEATISSSGIILAQEDTDEAHYTITRSPQNLETFC